MSGALLVFIAAITTLATPPASAAAPTNDHFVDAEDLTGAMPISAGGTNVDATKEAGEPLHAGNGGGASVWFSWTPAAAADVEIDMCGADFDTLLAVYTGATVDALTEVRSNDDAGDCGLASRVTFGADAGTTYLIAVDGFDGAQGTFPLNVTEVVRPANDDFADAHVLSGTLPIQVAGNNEGATSEPGEPEHVLSDGRNSVWYRWTADRTGPITIETCETVTGFFHAIAVYTGTQVDALTQLQADDNQCSPFSRLTLDAVVGTTYHIAVAGYLPGAEGDLILTLRTGAPANDNLAKAQIVDGPLPIMTPGSSVDATNEVDELEKVLGTSGYLDTTIWYGWTPVTTQRVAIETCGSSYDTALSVFTGTTYDTLTSVGGNGDACGLQSRVTFPATAGTTYRIVIIGGSGADGDTVLTIREAGPGPGNDDFANARVVSGRLPIVVFGTNEGAGAEPGEPDHEGEVGGASVWYRWTSYRTRDVVVDTCGSVPATLLGVYRGTALDELTEVEGFRDECFGRSRLRFTARAGRTYQIAVDGFGQDSGAFRLRIRPHHPPANDDFAHAMVLGGTLPIHADGSTVDATFEPGEPPDYVASGLGHSVWYRWTATASGEVTVESCKSHEPTVVSIWTGTSVDGLAQAPGQRIAACQIAPGSTAFFEGAATSISFPAVAGTTYRIALDGLFAVLDKDNDNAVGEVRLTIRNTAHPANDDFADAQQLRRGLRATARGSNADATREPNEPAHFQRSIFETADTSVWYRWTAAASGDFVAETCGSSFDTVVAVYTGDTVDSLVPVDNPQQDIHDDSCGRSGRYRFTATPGTTYRIAVSGVVVDQGAVRLRLRRASPPANDDLADALLVSGRGGTPTEGDNIDATDEPDETSEMRSSVWYRWIPQTTREVVIETCGTDFDTALAVFTGSSYANLTEVAFDDDTCGRRSKVRLLAEAGTSYLIAVGGHFWYQGPIALVIRRPHPPDNDDFADARRLRGPGTIEGSTTNATREAQEPNHAGIAAGASVWFRWKPSQSTQAEIDTCDSSFSTVLGVYTGSAIDGLHPVTVSADQACGDQSMVVFDAVAGTTYRIAVDAADYFLANLPGKEGPIRLTLTCDNRRCD